MKMKGVEEISADEENGSNVWKSPYVEASFINSMMSGPKEDGNNGGDKDQGNKEEVKDHTIPYYKLFYFADSRDILLMVAGTIGAIGNGMAMPLTTILFGNIMDSFGEDSYASDVIKRASKVCLDFVWLAIGTGIACLLQVTCWVVTGERQAARMRNMYLRAILRQEVAFFDREITTGEVVSRMSGDTMLIQDAMGEKVGKFIQTFSTFIGGFVVAFIKGWQLSLVMVTTLPPLIMASSVMANVMSKMASRGQEAYAKASVVVEQTLGAIRTVASFTGEKRAIKEYEHSLNSAYKASILEGITIGTGFGTALLIMFCGYSLGVWYGAKLKLDKDYSGGEVINVVMAILTASFSLGQTSPCLTAFAAGQAAAYKLFEAIYRNSEIDPCDTTGKKLDVIRGDIEFKDVYFSYPTRPDVQIFDGFSLTINSGLSVALVGESGSGKSTVISLIERFYDPLHGEVLIDGTNLKEFQLQWIRSKIGLVSQEPVLFSSSIKDNITYGKEGATTEEIRAAAELANALKFIDEMPQGLETMVGEHGTQLSGGQKQRIAIARAILKNPRILLLDEATSALDPEYERIVQEALDRVMMDRTTVVVAHRLTTVQNVDMIAVIHRGKIVEKGPHSELIKISDGAYSQLVCLQEIEEDLYPPFDLESNSMSIGATRKSSLFHYLQRSISRGSSISLEAVRQSSLRRSMQPSISRRSSGGSSIRNSLSVQFGTPTELEVVGSASLDHEIIESKEKPPDVSILRLASLNKPEIFDIILGIFAASVSGMIMPIFGLILSSIVKAFYEIPSKLKKDSKFWACMFLLIGVVAQFSYPLRSYFFARAGSKLVKRIRLMCFKKLINMEVGWFDLPENSSGAMSARLSVDAAAVRSLVGDFLAVTVQNVASLAAGLIIAFIANWKLSLIVLALLPFLIGNGFVQTKIMKGFSEDAKAKYEEASQVACDAVGSVRTVASFTAEDRVVNLYKQKCKGPSASGVRQGLINGVGFGLSFFFLYCVYATVFYAGARYVEDGTTTFDDVFRVFLAVTMAAIGVSQSSALAPDAVKAKSSAASVFHILDRKSKADPSDESGNTPNKV